MDPAVTLPTPRWMAVARGDEPADVVVSGGKVLSVFTREWLDADIAIADGHIIGDEAVINRLEAMTGAKPSSEAVVMEKIRESVPA